MALQLRRKTHESIVYIDKDSAPRIMPFGEDFILNDIPIAMDDISLPPWRKDARQPPKDISYPNRAIEL